MTSSRENRKRRLKRARSLQGDLEARCAELDNEAMAQRDLANRWRRELSRVESETERLFRGRKVFALELMQDKRAYLSRNADVFELRADRITCFMGRLRSDADDRLCIMSMIDRGLLASMRDEDRNRFLAMKLRDMGSQIGACMVRVLRGETIKEAVT